MGIQKGGVKGGGWREMWDTRMQRNVHPDLHCLGLNLIQPLAPTLQSRLVVSEQHCAAARVLHPALNSHRLSIKVVSV